MKTGFNRRVGGHGMFVLVGFSLEIRHAGDLRSRRELDGWKEDGYARDVKVRPGCVGGVLGYYSSFQRTSPRNLPQLRPAIGCHQRALRSRTGRVARQCSGYCQLAELAAPTLTGQRRVPCLKLRDEIG